MLALTVVIVVLFGLVVVRPQLGTQVLATGATGPRGPAGPPAPPRPESQQPQLVFFARSAAYVVPDSGPEQFLAVSGVSDATLDYSQVEMVLASAFPCGNVTLMRFEAIDFPPTNDTQRWTGALRVNGLDRAQMSCVLAFPADSCTATGHTALTDGDRLSFHVGAIDDPPATGLSFTWQCQAPRYG